MSGLAVLARAYLRLLQQAPARHPEAPGHGPGQETLQVGKREVLITELTPVGHYAVQPRFSDGHSSGLFAWDFLYFLGTQQDTLWAEYLAKLAKAGASRDIAAVQSLNSTEIKR